MIILALDTCLGACSVALVEDGCLRAAASEAMTRGHQERLAPMTREVMAQAHLDLGAVDRIAVTVGPGSFTGVRVGLAFAKGLGLALGRPCVGVGTLPALAATVGGDICRVATVGAGREGIAMQIFEPGVPPAPPRVLAMEAAIEIVAALGARRDVALVGPGALLLAGAGLAARIVPLAAPSAETVARLAEEETVTAPVPLYLRAADARPKAP